MRKPSNRNVTVNPLRWTHRHHRLVELAVLGMTNNEMAETLGYTAARCSQLIHHPEIEAAITQLRNQMRDRSLGTLQDDLAKDARETFDTLKRHRDADDPDVSLKACGMLWDRQIPKRVESKSEQVVRFVIEAKDMAYLKQVAAEDDLDHDADYQLLEDHAHPTETG